MITDAPLQGFGDIHSENWVRDLETSLLLAQVYSLFIQCRENELGHGPISPEGLWFLGMVQMLGKDATPGEVAKRMVRKQNSTSGMMNRLIKKGFIEKKWFKKHGTKPQIRISLTESGKRLYNGNLISAAIPNILSCLTTKENQEFRRLLFKIRKQAAEIAKVYDDPPYPTPDSALKER